MDWYILMTNVYLIILLVLVVWDFSRIDFLSFPTRMLGQLGLFAYFTIFDTPFPAFCRHQNTRRQPSWAPALIVSVRKKRFFPVFFFFVLRDFFSSFLVRDDPNFADLLLCTSGRWGEYTSTLWGWGGLHLSSSKSYQLSIIDKPTLLSIIDW